MTDDRRKLIDKLKQTQGWIAALSRDDVWYNGVIDAVQRLENPTKQAIRNILYDKGSENKTKIKLLLEHAKIKKKTTQSATPVAIRGGAAIASFAGTGGGSRASRNTSATTGRVHTSTVLHQLQTKFPTIPKQNLQYLIQFTISENPRADNERLIKLVTDQINKTKERQRPTRVFSGAAAGGGGASATTDGSDMQPQQLQRRFTQIRPLFPRTIADQVLKFYIHKYKTTTDLGALMSYIELETGIDRPQSTAQQGGATGIQKYLIIPSQQQQHQQRSYDIHEGGQSFTQWVESQMKGISSKVRKKLIESAKNAEQPDDLSTWIVYNTSGNGFCLINAWAQYVYLTRIKKNRVKPIPKVTINIDNIKRILSEAYKTSPQKVKTSIDKLSDEDRIQNLSQSVVNLPFDYFDLLPYFESCPVDVLLYSISPDGEFNLMKDTREKRRKLPIIRIFIVGDTGHFRILLEPSAINY